MFPTFSGSFWFRVGYSFGAKMVERFNGAFLLGSSIESFLSVLASSVKKSTVVIGMIQPVPMVWWAIHLLTGSHWIQNRMQMHHTSPEYDANGQDCIASAPSRRFVLWFYFGVMHNCKVSHRFTVMFCKAQTWLAADLGKCNLRTIKTTFIFSQ